MTPITMLKDPDDKLYYLWDITDFLAKSHTSVASNANVQLIPTGVTVLDGPDVQGDTGGLIVAMVTGVGSCTARVTCVNMEQFDSTIVFTAEEH